MPGGAWNVKSTHKSWLRWLVLQSRGGHSPRWAWASTIGQAGGLSNKLLTADIFTSKISIRICPARQKKEQAKDKDKYFRYFKTLFAVYNFGMLINRWKVRRSWPLRLCSSRQAYHIKSGLSAKPVGLPVSGWAPGHGRSLKWTPPLNPRSITNILS